MLGKPSKGWQEEAEARESHQSASRLELRGLGFRGLGALGFRGLGIPGLKAHLEDHGHGT